MELQYSNSVDTMAHAVVLPEYTYMKVAGMHNSCDEVAESKMAVDGDVRNSQLSDEWCE